MLSSAHDYILAMYGRENHSCPGNKDAERFLIAHDYAVYVKGKEPLLRLTSRAEKYAQRFGKSKHGRATQIANSAR